ncbi:arabinose efflux permease family protein [Rivularia sp. PCC 7116]|uniref:MFS transporter n=1 Tax=Rivularia sp. PCC 7116 TaxID=373994 RepID=UPI00029F33C5|nr:MFS transporter [Rivularia sp. PCC 7116]AFY58718.1 arabinose efflux permease family protein [Rivularia sp. PCC 7116]
MLSKLILLAALYTAQFIPTTFFIQTVPIFMRQQNMSLDAIGFLSFLILPSALKFLWSPFIDRYRIPKLGHYRGWIIVFQILLAIVTFGCAFIDIENNFNTLIICMFCAFLFSSSQDIATDAIAVNLLEPNERGIGNAIQSGGNIFGAIIGGGGVLILLDRVGWKYSLIIISLVMLITLIPVLLYSEVVNRKPKKSNFFKSYFQPFINFLSRPKALPWLLVLVLYMGGEMMSGTMLRPLFVDRGLSLSEIGVMLGIFSYSVRIISALIAGVLITKLGRINSLILFGLAASIATLLYIIPASGVSNLPILYAVTITVNALQGMAYTALLSAMMDKCVTPEVSSSAYRHTAATDYTLQVSVVSIGGVAASMLSGTIASATGYTGMFIISAAVSILSVLVIFQFFRRVAVEAR